MHFSDHYQSLYPWARSASIMNNICSLLSVCRKYYKTQWLIIRIKLANDAYGRKATQNEAISNSTKSRPTYCVSYKWWTTFLMIWTGCARLFYFSALSTELWCNYPVYRLLQYTALVLFVFRTHYLLTLWRGFQSSSIVTSWSLCSTAEKAQCLWCGWQFPQTLLRLTYKCLWFLVLYFLELIDPNHHAVVNLENYHRFQHIALLLVQN